MKTICKWIVLSGVALFVIGAWTIWISERFYRHGYSQGRIEYLMDDKERYGVRKWLEKHPEDAEKILGGTSIFPRFSKLSFISCDAFTKSISR